ncbi:hypothetical protein PSACC_00203 [Paramicrosporidium saccamoebae]|uniref:Uncharacterized protein n=1 Tax=Paramicrosporidium saccamoebae TaxID=1246581 RepID=A0A2H9TQI4_9FUNG|nr:hypothetical protein PSACC_00203 [Paramicrosporidium saccamoebae]
MDTVITVFALACTTVAGMRTCYLGLLAENLNGWLTVGEMFVHSVVLFSGMIVAAGAASWSYGVGGGLVCTFIGLLAGRCWWEHRKNVRLAEVLGGLCPNGSWSRAESFRQALSVSSVSIALIFVVAARNHGKGYDAYLTGNRYLSIQTFKKGCLSTVACFEVRGFGKMVTLLLFVEPTEVSYCQKWFGERGTILGNFRKELTDVIKHLWKKKTLVRSLQLDCTLNAMRRLDDEKQQALHEAYPWDLWIEAYLPRLPGMNVVTPEQHWTLAANGRRR